jgi:stage V sporulation protein SpoVS
MGGVVALGLGSVIAFVVSAILIARGAAMPMGVTLVVFGGILAMLAIRQYQSNKKGGGDA